MDATQIMTNKESIAVKNHELQDATNFKQIFNVYIEALEEKSALYNYEKKLQEILCVI